MIEHMSEDDVRLLFKPEYYKCVPTEFINYISILYESGKRVRIGRSDLEKKLAPKNKRHAKILNLYRDEAIEEMEIDLDFKAITQYVNDALEYLIRGQ